MTYPGEKVLKLKQTVRTLVITIWLTFWISWAALGQEMEYGVGFKVISAVDSSRNYKPGTDVTDKLHYRPIEIDLWYPADIAVSDTTATFEDLVYLLERRSKYFDDAGNYDGLTDELLRYICAGLDCPDHAGLRRVRTQSYVNAKPNEHQSPLIVYFTAFNGMSYENYQLFEALVKNGFVVASVSSIGRYPGNMTMEYEDIFEQIKDAEFAIDYLTNRNLASRDIGLIGYSWGGLAASILAMKEPVRIKAVVSLDGSEQFNYAGGLDDEKLNRIRAADSFTPETINASFLYLDSDLSESDDLPDSVYNITDYILGDKSYLMIGRSTHEDFSGISTILSADRKSRHALIQKLTIAYMLDKLKGNGVFDKSIPDGQVTRHFSLPSMDSQPAGKIILRGVVQDRKTGFPLPYVNIGIFRKDVGTTSNIKGEFELPLPDIHIDDTLKISMVGYEPKEIYLRDVFEKRRRELIIQLKEKTDELREVVVTEKRLTTRVLGNKSNSKFFGGKFASGDLGSEIAIRIRIRQAPTYLERFSFNISYNDGDTATFRVNVYDMQDGLPNKNILSDNILVKVNGQSGKVDIDLSTYNIIVNGDFFIGLEWVEGRSNSGIVFSSGFANRGTYYRKASQGRWKKYAMGVGFNVKVTY